VSVLHVLGDANGERPAGLPGWRDAPDDYVPCCYGAAHNGPRGCTCWEPVFDVEQARPVQFGPMPLATKCCHDCAYRHNSPERQAGEFDHLEEVALNEREVFVCHQGMCRVVGWRHPEIGELPYAGAGDYRPPISNGHAWLADGRPATLCAGWGAIGNRRADQGSSRTVGQVNG
jgi:hypothetical protein